MDVQIMGFVQLVYLVLSHSEDSGLILLVNIKIHHELNHNHTKHNLP